MGGSLFVGGSSSHAGQAQFTAGIGATSTTTGLF